MKYLTVCLWLAGCSAVFGRPIDRVTVPAACGMCVFHEDRWPGCYWAIEYEGSIYAVNGPVPQDHDAHAPDGMCAMRREAVVSGTIRGDQVFADSFELLPVDPTAAPARAAEPHTH